MIREAVAHNGPASEFPGAAVDDLLGVQVKLIT
jgi:hypothetical protein